MRLLLFFLCIPVLAFGQESILVKTEPIPSNFELAMSVSTPTEAQFDSIFSLTTGYVNISGDSSLLLAEMSLELSEDNPDQKFYLNALMRVGDAHRIIGNIEKSKEVLTETHALAKSMENQKIEATTINLLGLIDMNLGGYKDALAYFVEAAKIFEEIGDKKYAAAVYFNMGIIFFNIEEPNNAQKYIRKVQDIAEEINDEESAMNASGLLGNVCMHQGSYFFTKAYDDSTERKIYKDSAAFFFDKSQVELNKSLVLAKKLNNQRKIVITLNNLVALKINTRKYDEALILAEEAEKRAHTIGAINVFIQSTYNLSGVYQMVGRYEEAEEYAKKALALAEENGLKRQVNLAHRSLYRLYKSMGKYDQAIVFQQKLYQYDSEIMEADRTKALASITAQYEKVKDEKKILELENDKKQQRMIIGGGLLLLILGLIVFQLNKTRKDRNDKMAFAEALLFAQEGERKRIARDLHDGVGQSLLLVKKQMGTSLKVSAENQQLITDTLEEVRSISRDLHPIQLEKLGLTTAIHDVIEKVERSTDLFITKEIMDLDGLFSEKETIHIFRAIQEALNNIVKHADATAARITIESIGRNIVIKVMDNGKGFDHELAVVKSKSLGLRTMHERISSMGGQMKIEKNDPSGILTTFTIPLKQK